MTKLPSIIGINPWSWKDIVINTVLFKDYIVQHLWFIYILFFFFLFNRLFKDVLINGKVFVIIIMEVSCHRGMGIYKASKTEINDVLFRIPSNHYFST